MQHQQALTIAMQAHDGQTDKSGAPYIHHPVAVAGLVQQVPTFLACSSAQKESIVQGALLHDVVEDTEWTLEELAAAGMEPLTVEIVKAMTHIPEESRSTYITRVSAHPLARIIKIADIAHNTDPERLHILSADAQAALLRKYSMDIATILAGHDDDYAWLQHERPALFG